MSCGRLSRASDAWRARFDAAHKRVNAIFVQPLSNWATCPYCASEGVIGQSADNRYVLRNDWLTRIQGRAPAHNAAAKAFFKLHYQLSILPAILTAFVGSSLFYGVQDPTLKL